MDEVKVFSRLRTLLSISNLTSHLFLLSVSNSSNDGFLQMSHLLMRIRLTNKQDGAIVTLAWN
jgi:hypothetical protein